jgi:HTH-type transcriptional regulator, glycine betaine synthesis regulator
MPNEPNETQVDLEQFIETWGTMGVLWGINRSMARIHGLLLVSVEPVCLDDISEQLAISRGNTSMCLKELRSWGVIQRVNVAGDRKDYYVVEPDVWRMLFRIAIERKKREFDPAREALRRVMRSALPAGSKEVRGRLAQMDEILDSVDQVAARFLANERSSKLLLRFLTGKILAGGSDELA